MNVNLYSGPGVKRLTADFLNDLNNSVQLTKVDYGKRNIIVKFKESLFRLFSPLL